MIGTKFFENIKKSILVNSKAPLYTDVYRLSVIINNLVSNAIKYRDANKQQSLISIEASISESNLFVVFTDNGIGISQDYINKIFDMFFRATDRSEGAGLGLYIVKETVEKLHGDIRVESKMGEGTVFTIRVPNMKVVKAREATLVTAGNARA